MCKFYKTFNLFLKRIIVLFSRDDKMYENSNHRNFLNQCDQYNHWTSSMSKNKMVQPEAFHTSAS